MFRPPFWSSIVLACALVTACAALAAAQLPDPTQSHNDGPFMLGNARGGPPTGLANVPPALYDGYQVVLIDMSGAPLPNQQVVIYFAGSGLQVHATQTGWQVADCAANTITAVTNAIGQVTFNPAVVGISASPEPAVPIFGDGVYLTSVRIPSVDVANGPAGAAGRVDGWDLNEFRLRLLELRGCIRTDPAFDYAPLGASAGVVDGYDFNVMRFEYLCGQPGGGPPPCSQTVCP
jgi:hypothetical protein